MDFLLFSQGLASFLIGVAAFSGRDDAILSWRWLFWASWLFGLRSWLGVAEWFWPNEPVLFALLSPVLFLAAFAALAEFGRRGLRWKWLRWWTLVPLFVVAAWFEWSRLLAAGIAARVLVGVPAMGMAAAAFWNASRKVRDSETWKFRTPAIGCAAMGILFAALPDVHQFHSVFHFPAQGLFLVFLLMVGFGIWSYLRPDYPSTGRDRFGAEPSRWWHGSIPGIVLIGLVSVLGWHRMNGLEQRALDMSIEHYRLHTRSMAALVADLQLLHGTDAAASSALVRIAALDSSIRSVHVVSGLGEGQYHVVSSQKALFPSHDAALVAAMHGVGLPPDVRLLSGRSDGAWWLVSRIPVSSRGKNIVAIEVDPSGAEAGAKAMRWHEMENTMLLVMVLLVASLLRAKERAINIILRHSCDEFLDRHRKCEALQTELKADSFARAEYLAAIAAELRSKLHSVLDLFSPGSEGVLQPSVSSRVKPMVDECLWRVDDIGNFSEAESGQLMLRSNAFPLRSVLESEADFHKAMAQEKGIRFDVSIAETVPAFAIGDGTRLRQIFRNLLGNAVGSTQVGGVRLEVDVLQVGATLRLQGLVEDTGPGISESEAEQAFRFGGTTRERRGLGLPVVAKLVERMGGGVSMESRPGLGACLHFHLRLLALADQTVDGQTDRDDVQGSSKSDSVTSLSMESQVAEAYSWFGLRILLVEDNPVNQKVARLMLARMGMQCAVAENGQMALDYLREHPCDLVFMDVHMPVMDGMDATRKIRAGEAGVRARGVRIVALTALALAGDRERCLESGMDGYMTKPVSVDMLRKELSFFQGQEHSEELPVFSKVELLERVGGSGSTAALLVPAFLEESSRQFQMLAEAAKVNSMETILGSLHVLRGSVATLAGLRLQALLASLEQSARKGELAPYQTWLEQVEQGLHELQEQVSGAFAESSPP